MRLRLWPAVCGALAVLIQAAGAQAGPPVTDPGALAPVAGDACTPDERSPRMVHDAAADEEERDP